MKGETEKSEGSYPAATGELAKKRREFASDTEAAFQAFSHKVFAEGALPVKVKQLVAVAVAHVTQCPYCIKGHTKAALRHGASEQELMEAIWVAAEMRAGGVDWRLHLYGKVVHSFTNPQADKMGRPEFARYDAGADGRSWAEMIALFDEVFA